MTLHNLHTLPEHYVSASKARAARSGAEFVRTRSGAGLPSATLCLRRGGAGFRDAGQQGFGRFVVGVLADKFACKGFGQNALVEETLSKIGRQGNG